jgi:hypothetical protein
VLSHRRADRCRTSSAVSGLRPRFIFIIDGRSTCIGMHGETAIRVAHEAAMLAAAEAMEMRSHHARGSGSIWIGAMMCGAAGRPAASARPTEIAKFSPLQDDDEEGVAESG